MIECTSENIYYANKRRCGKSKKPKRFFAFIFIVILIIGGFLYYKYVITENIIFALSVYLKEYSTDSINETVEYTLKDKIKYEDLIVTEKNDNGDIVFMSTNSYKVNSISNEISLITQEKLKAKLSKGIEIPFMAFTGIKILSGYGSKVNFSAISVSNVICDFISDFKSSGINQTIHYVYVVVKTNVAVAMPKNNKIIEAESKILITQAVLVGKVPEVYLNGQIFS